MEVHSEELSARRNRNLFVKVLLGVFCSIMIVFVTAYLTTVFSVKPTIDINSAKRQEQQLCIAKLQAEKDVYSIRALLSPSGSQERAEWVAKLNTVINKLERIDLICFNQNGS